MDAKLYLENENPRQNANIFSILCFTWIIKLFRKGTRHGLTVKDLYKTLDHHKSQYLGDTLEKNWYAELSRAKAKNVEPSLYKALKKTFMLSYLFYGLLLFIQIVIFRSFQPAVLEYLVHQFSLNPNEPGVNTKLYISAGLLILISLLIVFIGQHCYIGQGCMGMRIRIAVSSLAYRKLLRLSKKSLAQTTTGQIINLLSNDVARFDQVALYLNFIWITPFHVAIVTYYAWNQVGIACLSGILSMTFFTVPLQVLLGSIVSKLRVKLAARTDKRVRHINEIITGIQVIKMHAWEKAFEKLVTAVRTSEIKVLTLTTYIRAIILSFMVLAQRTSLYLTTITYVLLGNILTAEKVASVSYLYNILQLTLATFLPSAIYTSAEAKISIRRLTTFLILEEKEEFGSMITTCNAIHLSKVFASWGNETNLKNINIQIPAGKLCAIIGTVGSGKSSFLQLILKELSIFSGNINIRGNISYCPQESWLFRGSLRDNILFGEKFNQRKYQRVVKLCELSSYFNQLPQGDSTIVEERGANMSGGQRARLNLARAVYRDVDIYLLDDPLSAVDTLVGKRLFEECILKYLRNKTRILVTHQLQYIKKADMIIVLNNGEIESYGTFDELMRKKLCLMKIMATSHKSTDNDEIEFQERRQSNVFTNTYASVDKNISIYEEGEEEVTVTRCSLSNKYIEAAGKYHVLIMVVFLTLLAQIVSSGADYWAYYWTEQEISRHSNTTNVNYENILDVILNCIGVDSSNITLTSENKDIAIIPLEKDAQNQIDTYLATYIYTGIIISAITLILARAIAISSLTINASKNLHSRMFSSLLNAPMVFFNTNPSGMVLNRFSKDMGAVDQILPRVAYEAMVILLHTIGLVVLVIIANYYTVIPVLIGAVLFLVLRIWLIKTVKALKHIEGEVKSPIFSHINASLNGITTIRAFNNEQLLIKDFDNMQDVHTSAWFLCIAGMSAFGLWLDLVCILFTATVTFTFVVLNKDLKFSESMVGLAISQSLVLAGMLQFGMKQSAEVADQMTSVERILQYSSLQQEDLLQHASPMLESWPSNGSIKFSNVYLSYTHDTYVLNDLNLCIEPGQKVGVVGRSGAGKSSIISALLRFAPLQGSIQIDNIDTKKICLYALRKRISIIPQEPILFGASMRFNLDPFEEYSDDLLWNALEEVNLKEVVTSLHMLVNDGGSNFSLGQRQLICLARAILRNNKILVLDEATANVDHITDDLIQKTIRKKFCNCTVLTIAHRLNTIMDSDKVMVIESGRMVEFDHPYILLQNKDGAFRKLAEQAGSNLYRSFIKIAHEAYSTASSVAQTEHAITDAIKNGNKANTPEIIDKTDITNAKLNMSGDEEKSKSSY